VNDRLDQFATTQRIKKSPRAFTLVELLVVIAIVGVLAALIIPAVKSGLSSAKSVQSVSNLKQIGVLVGNYAAENNNQLPYAAVWGKIFGGALVYFSRSLSEATIPGFKYAKSPQSALRPLPKIFYDPVLESNSLPPHEMGAFGVNASIVRDVWSEDEKPTSLNGISRTSQKVIMGSMNSKAATKSGGWRFLGEEFVQMGMDSTDCLDPRNAGKAACLFADGHVERLDVKNMDQETRKKHFTLDP
jgi:prepilin-type N-terminal cleavage/methylation domain-containing protein/prepilin-type processing-associated H-X9-DG protein